ncbi:hypothetical protein LY76DRAFT_154940 [Colletotrichum caudatum]|nr:hypothetical protein LY76DRAFT_154940 [Colletotrichum caudatum]
MVVCGMVECGARVKRLIFGGYRQLGSRITFRTGLAHLPIAVVIGLSVGRTTTTTTMMTTYVAVGRAPLRYSTTLVVGKASVDQASF